MLLIKDVIKKMSNGAYTAHGHPRFRLDVYREVSMGHNKLGARAEHPQPVSLKVEGPLVGILDLRARSKVRSILRKLTSYGSIY